MGLKEELGIFVVQHGYSTDGDLAIYVHPKRIGDVVNKLNGEANLNLDLGVLREKGLCNGYYEQGLTKLKTRMLRLSESYLIGITPLDDISTVKLRKIAELLGIEIPGAEQTK